MSSRPDNLRAWALCAPAVFALLGLNVVPAVRALIEAPPRPLMAELSSWAIASFAVAAQTLLFCVPALLFEIPIALLLAVALLQRRAALPAERSDRLTAIAAVLAAFAWRLVFGGAIGSAPSDAPDWTMAALEVWRTLPLATLLLFAALRRRGTPLAEVATLDGAASAQTLRRVHLPLCRSAIAALTALHVVDYLRALHAPLISPGSADRAIWTVLVMVVAILGFRVADRPASV